MPACGAGIVSTCSAGGGDCTTTYSTVALIAGTAANPSATVSGANTFIFSMEISS